MATLCFILLMTLYALNVSQTEHLAFRPISTFTKRDLPSQGFGGYNGRQGIQGGTLDGRIAAGDIAVRRGVSMTTNQRTVHQYKQGQQPIINSDGNYPLKGDKMKTYGITGDAKDMKHVNHTFTFKKQTSSPNEEAKCDNEARTTVHKSLRFEPRRGKCRINENRTTANCSCLGLSRVPQNLPTNITALILSNNRLSFCSLNGGPFRKYQRLLYLKLDNNAISALPDMAFEGLLNLVHLDLYNNSIKLDGKLNQSKVFAPLNVSLQELILNRNDRPELFVDERMYPDKALSYLSNLQTLEIDGLPNKTFGFHFRKMKNLTSLQMSGYRTGYCDLSYLTNQTFENVPSITHLNVTDCSLRKHKMEISVLEPLVNLELLDVSYNFDLGFQGLGDMMYGQRSNRNLKHLYLNVIGDRYEPCIIVYKENVRYFVNLHLESIQANGNGIEMIDHLAIAYLPKTLKKIDLRRNNIMMGDYWKELHKMKYLQTLHLDGFDEAYKLPLYIPKPFHCASSNERKRIKSFSKENAPGKESFLNLALPPSLENITMSRYFLSYQITKIKVDPMNKLQSLNMHGNYLPKLIGPVIGVDKLERLDLSNCNVEYIAGGFFSNFESLKVLNLYRNFLGEYLHANRNESLFCSQSLRDLNLGMNNIYQLSKDVFQDCTKLTSLDLSKNRLDVAEMWTKNMPSLSHLNLSRNRVSTLPQKIMDHFDWIIKSGEHASIDMTFNPIACDCNNINFLKWVTRTKIFGKDYKNYRCYDSEHQTTKEITEGYDKELELLIRQCVDNSKLLICVISATLAFFIILIGVVIYRFRWTMRYWYHVVKLMWTHGKGNTSIEYEYDVFVCHCHQDKSFITEELDVKLGTERGLKLLLHDQCFQAGQKITENILRAVQQCRKTLVVISRAMLASSWCDHELEMARQEAIATGRNVLVFLFFEKIDSTSLGPDLSNYIRSNVFVMYPNNPADLEAFWNKLAADLKS